MDLLARREHSRNELIAKLKKRFEDDSLIIEVVDILVNEGLLSDERFTENYIRWRRERGFGPIRIRCELIEHGVNEEIIRANLDIQDEAWTERAQKEWQKKFNYCVPKNRHERAKQQRFLLYRGFTMEQIAQVDLLRVTPAYTSTEEEIAFFGMAKKTKI